MTRVSGEFTGKVNWQTNVSLPLANHQLTLVEVSGKLDSPDNIWNGNVMTYWNVIDIIGDKGTYYGYYTVIDKDEDRAWGSAEGRTFTSGGQVKMEGTFKPDGGTGKFRRYKGKGKLKGHFISPTEVTFDWKGEYEI